MVKGTWQFRLLLAVVCLPLSLLGAPCKMERQGRQKCGCAKIHHDDSSENTGEDSEFLYIDDMAFPKPHSVQNVVSGLKWAKSGLKIGFWPGGIICYILDKAFTSDYRKRIEQAMATIQSTVGKQHIQFRDARTHGGAVCRMNRLFVRRLQKEECVSMVGMARNGTTYTWLNERDCNEGIIQHELMHALGRIHEHVRPDRDRHVVVIYDNIISRFCYNYVVSTRTVKDDPSLRLPYDTQSIMSYASCTFTCNGNYTMLAIDRSVIKRNRKRMTTLDTLKLRAMYPANSMVPNKEAGKLGSAVSVILFYLTMRFVS